MSDDGPRQRDEPVPPGRPALKRRDVLALIAAAYRTSFPYVLLVVLVLLIATWLVTEVFFGS